MFILGLVLTLISMFFFALSQPKHTAKLKPHPKLQNQPRYARAIAIIFLVLAAAVSIMLYGLGLGIVSACAWLCLSGWLVTLTISIRSPRK